MSASCSSDIEVVWPAFFFFKKVGNGSCDCVRDV